MRGLAVWLEDRTPPVFATVVMVVAVMAFSLLGHVVLHGGQGGLLAPSDLWSLAGSSSAILHGDFAHVYIRHGALTSPPAFEIALAPVMALGQLVGLSPHHRAAGEPLSMWLVLGPAAVLLASTALFAVDAAARAWRFSEQRRLALALVGGLGVANVSGYWGHPEDCMAVAFVLWAALSMERRGSAGATRAALLLGIGIAFQPLALLAVAPILARLTWRRAARLVGWLVLPSLVVLAGPLLAESHRTLFVLVRQPFQLKWVSLTPLTSLTSHLAPGLDGGGPTRLVAILVASALAIEVSPPPRPADGADDGGGRLLPPHPPRDGDELVLPLARPGALPPVGVAARPLPLRRVLARPGGLRGAGQPQGPRHRAVVARAHGDGGRHAAVRGAAATPVGHRGDGPPTRRRDHPTRRVHHHEERGGRGRAA